VDSAAEQQNTNYKNMNIYFQYGEKEIEHLKKADKKLAAVINRIGVIERAVNPDLFSALVNYRWSTNLYKSTSDHLGADAKRIRENHTCHH
jgi:hypothetical protein